MSAAARRIARARQRAADKPVEDRLRAAGRLQEARFIRRQLWQEYGQRATLAQVEHFLALPDDVRGEFGPGVAGDDLSPWALDALLDAC